MIIVRLCGGLGNQMFQYAAARRLAYTSKSELKLDLSWFRNIAARDTHRNYELGIFNIMGNIATSDEVHGLRGPDIYHWPRIMRGLVKASGYTFKRSYIREKQSHFSSAILDLRDSVYLDGYWQSEKYFQDVEALIRDEFTFLPDPDPLTLSTMKIIDDCEAISIHVRRGDYVSVTSASNYHGLLTLDYYSKAIVEMAKRIANPHFFVFSDDPDWVKDNLKCNYPMSYIEHNGANRAYEDMRLMSRCRHHIVANSSFSWWGAWLNASKEKIVIAPSRWFKEPISTQDLIPSTWILI